MTRIDMAIDWCELDKRATAEGWKLTYRIARCQHGKTRQQTCIDCEGGYVDDTHTFANIGDYAVDANRNALVAVSDDGADVAYVSATNYARATRVARSRKQSSINI